MAISTIQAASDALKTFYLGTITKQLDENSGPLMAALKKTEEYVEGGTFKFPLQYGRHGGIGARTEGSDLPDANPRKFKQASASPKDIYARIQITDKLIKASKGNRGAFADQLKMQMEDLLTDSKDMLRRMLVGDSKGVIATVADDATANATVEVDNTIALYPGQYIDILTSDGDTKKVDKKEIVNVDKVNNTITLESAVTVVATDIVTLAGNYNNEFCGLKDIFTLDSSIYGINRSTYKWFNPIVEDIYSGGVAQALDTIDMQKVMDDIEDTVGEPINMIITTPGVLRAYVDHEKTYKTNIEYMTVDGGFKLASYSGTPISKEKYAQKERMKFLNTKHILIAQLDDWDWLDKDGNVLSRISNKAAYEATLVKYAELICRKMASQGELKGIDEA